ncbi:MAG TPA: hypothetical protein PLX53_04250, partial [Tenuifilaceae bacterium]|nr:hypothetical protein [Tenuifilaceae bacterium]
LTNLAGAIIPTVSPGFRYGGVIFSMLHLKIDHKYTFFILSVWFSPLLFICPFLEIKSNLQVSPTKF